MTPGALGEIERALEAYDEGLAGHVCALEQFLALAVRQTDAARHADADALAATTAEREPAMAALLSAATGLAPVRRLVESLDGPWTIHDRWRSAAASRRRIGELVTRILAQDELTRASIAAGDERRQHERSEIDAASATVVAYRRTVAPPSRPASLLDDRG